MWYISQANQIKSDQQPLGIGAKIVQEKKRKGFTKGLVGSMIGAGIHHLSIV